MHELAIAQNIVSIVESEAKKRGFAKVLSITLAVGEYSGVVPECLLELFPIAAQGTAAESAALRTYTVPAAVLCGDCGYAGPPKSGTCPRCGSLAIRLTAGREFFVDSMEVE
jgi:hydrogenase nickel incorporation protein HypA/HybF